MRKLNFIAVMVIAAGMMLLAPGSASSDSEFYFEGGGYSYVFFAGGMDSMLIDELFIDTAYGTGHPVLELDGGYYVGALRANYLTVETLAMAYGGEIKLTQAYSNSQGQEGSIRSFVKSDGLGMLWGSGFYTALLADAPFVLSQYGERSNPELTYEVDSNSYPSTGGLGYSTMWAQLYEDWSYASYTIFEYLSPPICCDPGEGDPEVEVFLLLTEPEEGLDVDVFSTSTAPVTHIEAFYDSQIPKT